MALSDSGGQAGDMDVPLDPVDKAFATIRDLTDKSKPGAGAFTKSDAGVIATQMIIIESEMGALKDKIKELELIRDTCEKYHKTTPVQPTPGVVLQKTYSSVVASTKPVIDTRRILNVVPSTKQPPETTKQIVRMLVKGKRVRIDHMRTTAKGISVLCCDQSDVTILDAAIKANRAMNLTTKLVQKKNPTLTMFLQGKDHDDLRELTDDIIDKNGSLSDEGAFKLVHSYSTKNGNTVVVMEVTPAAYQRIAEDSFRIYAGDTKVTLREQNPVTQCFKCHKFGHKASKCNFTLNGLPATRCAGCGGSHAKEVVCICGVCCSNCSDYNEIASKRKWKTLDTRHKSTDTNCPKYKQAAERAKALINYA